MPDNLKTTILLPPQLHHRLKRLARRKRVSLGFLVREACEAQYAEVSPAERQEAARMLRALSLPVGTPGKLKQQAVPKAKDLLR